MLKPIGKRVLISRFDLSAVTNSGIIYSKAKEPIHRGRVEQDYQSEDVSLPVGTHILFEPNKDFPVGNENLLIIPEHCIIGTVEAE